MPFGNRLKEARINKGLTQEELAQIVGVTKGAIGNYESEVSSPKENILIKLMQTLDVDANFLFQDLVGAAPDVSLSQDEKSLLADYRSLSKEGKEYILQTMDMVKEKYPKNVSVPNMANLA